MKTYQIILLGVLVFGLGGYLVAQQFLTKDWNYDKVVIKSVNNPVDQAIKVIGKKAIIGLYFENTSKEYITGFSIMSALVSRILSEKAGVKLVSFGIVNGKCIPPFSKYNGTVANESQNVNNTLFDSRDPYYLQATQCTGPSIVIQKGSCNCIKINNQIIIEGDSAFLTSQENILSVQGFFSEVARKISVS